MASKKFCDKAQVDVNVGYTLVGHEKDTPEDDALHGGIALEYQLSDTWQWVGEYFGARDLRGDGELATFADTGFRYLIMDGLTADMAVGRGLRGPDAAHFTATIGLSWLFNVAN